MVLFVACMPMVVGHDRKERIGASLYQVTSFVFLNNQYERRISWV